MSLTKLETMLAGYSKKGGRLSGGAGAEHPYAGILDYSARKSMYGGEYSGGDRVISTGVPLKPQVKAGGLAPAMYSDEPSLQPIKRGITRAGRGKKGGRTRSSNDDFSGGRSRSGNEDFSGGTLSGGNPLLLALAPALAGAVAPAIGSLAKGLVGKLFGRGKADMLNKEALTRELAGSIGGNIHRRIKEIMERSLRDKNAEKYQIMIPEHRWWPKPPSKGKGGRSRSGNEDFSGGRSRSGNEDFSGGRSRGDNEDFSGGRKKKPKSQARSGAAKKRAATNPWLAHVKKVRAENPGVAYKDILKMAKSSYH